MREPVFDTVTPGFVESGRGALALVARAPQRGDVTPEEFAKLAAVEDRMWYFQVLHCLVRTLLLRHRDAGGTFRLIDAGAGTGGWLRYLARREPQWGLEGFDQSPDALTLSRQLGLPRPLLQGQIEEPPALEPADAVTCLDVLYMVEDLNRALDGLRTLVRPGGLLVVSGPAYDWMRSKHDEDVGGRRRFRRSVLAKDLTKAGFVPLQTTYWNTLAFPAAVLRRKVLPHAKGGEVSLGPGWLEASLRALGSIEAGWLAKGRTFAWGANVLLIARRS